MRESYFFMFGRLPKNTKLRYDPNNDNFSYQKDKSKHCEWKTCWVRERALLLKKAETLPMKISAYPLLEKTPLHELPSFLQGNLACLPEIILSQCTAFLKCAIYE